MSDLLKQSLLARLFDVRLVRAGRKAARTLVPTAALVGSNIVMVGATVTVKDCADVTVP